MHCQRAAVNQERNQGGSKHSPCDQKLEQSWHKHLGYRRAVLASVWGRDGFRGCASDAVSGACAAPGRDLTADYSSAIYSARYFLSSQSALGTREQTERSVVLVLVIPHGMIWHCF